MVLKLLIFLSANRQIPIGEKESKIYSSISRDPLPLPTVVALLEHERVGARAPSCATFGAYVCDRQREGGGGGR